MHTDGLRCVIVGAVLLLSSCTTNRINAPGAHDPVQVPRTGVLHLHATHTAPYCGGADPGPEGMPRPEPWSGSMFLRPATPDSTGTMAPNDLSVPITDTIRTDRTGNGYRTLPAGHYLLLDQEHTDDRHYRLLLERHGHPAPGREGIDTACMRQWLHGPFGVVAIRGGDTARVDLPLFDRCPWAAIPCMPMERSAPP